MGKLKISELSIITPDGKNKTSITLNNDGSINYGQLTGQEIDMAGKIKTNSITLISENGLQELPMTVDNNGFFSFSGNYDDYRIMLRMAGLNPNDYPSLTSAITSTTAMTAVFNNETSKNYVLSSLNVIFPAIMTSSIALDVISANSTLSNQILNSTTLMNIIGASNFYTIPTMTSNSSPSGQVYMSIGTPASLGNGFYVFDKNNGTSGDVYYGQATPLGNALAYDTTQPRYIYKVYFHSGIDNGGTMYSGLIEGSVDNVNWVTLVSLTSQSQIQFATHYVPFIKARYIRARATNSSNGRGFISSELNVWGKG